jgi:hypothetical protein
MSSHKRPREGAWPWTSSGSGCRKFEGTSIAFSEFRSCYQVWCAQRGETPLSQPLFAAALKALGYKKWKSCGLIRYRGLRLAALKLGCLD